MPVSSYNGRRSPLIPDILYQYRIHEESVMHIWDESRMEQRLNTAKWDFFEQYLTQWGLNDDAHKDKLHASSYKAVLDGLLHFRQHGGDRKKLPRMSPRACVFSSKPFPGAGLTFLFLL